MFVGVCLLWWVCFCVYWFLFGLVYGFVGLLVSVGFPLVCLDYVLCFYLGWFVVVLCIVGVCYLVIVLFSWLFGFVTCVLLFCFVDCLLLCAYRLIVDLLIVYCWFRCFCFGVWLGCRYLVGVWVVCCLRFCFACYVDYLSCYFILFGLLLLFGWLWFVVYCVYVYGCLLVCWYFLLYIVLFVTVCCFARCLLMVVIVCYCFICCLVG